MEGQIDLTTGKKYDGGKPRLDLLSTHALVAASDVMKFGAIKYGDNNWRGGIKWSRVFAALMRHAWYWWGGEDRDPETGLSHLAHCMCCIMFLLEYEQTHQELDDRWKPKEVSNGRGKEELKDDLGDRTDPHPIIGTCSCYDGVWGDDDYKGVSRT